MVLNSDGFPCGHEQSISVMAGRIRINSIFHVLQMIRCDGVL